MMVYVVNMDRDKERFTVISKRLTSLGVAFVRESAVCGKELPIEVKKSSVNRFRWWCAMGRSVCDGEVGCALSHFNIYRKIESVACIVEDDAIITDDFRKRLEIVESWVDAGKPQVVMMSPDWSVACHERRDWTIEHIDGATGTFGYVITKSAANAILNDNFPIKRACDQWGYWRKNKIIELYRAFPCVCLHARGVTDSSTVDRPIKSVKRMGKLEKAMYLIKRTVGLAMDRVLSA